MKKKKIPTDLEIKAEIAKLKKMKPSVKPVSMFGDRHHDAIDAQISVLEEHLDDGEIYDRYDKGPDNVLTAALEAIHWMDGDEEAAPSEDWKSLVK